MKVSDTEWQWDRNKLTIYFTAEKRVDFRALVRDLASLFRTRIELRQIGVRDEAARLARRRPLRPGVLLLHLAHRALAGEPRARQGPAPLAQPGADLRRLRPPALLPQVRARVLRHRAEALPQGGQDAADRASAPERVVAVDIFRERVFLRSEEHGPRIIPLVQLREEVERAGRRRSASRAESRRPRHRAAAADDAIRPRDGTGAPATDRQRRCRAAATPTAAGSGARSRRRAVRELSGQVLPHHRHRLLQRRPPSRPRAREGRRRLHRPLPPPPRRRGPFPHGDGRALPVGDPGGRAGRRRRRRRGSTRWPRGSPSFWRAARVQQRRLDPHHRAAAHARRSPSCSSRSSSATPTTSSSASTRGSTASAARSSSSRAQIVNGRCIEHPTLRAGAAPRSGTTSSG